MSRLPRPPLERHPGGRPPKTEVDPAIAKAICANVELGMPLRPAGEAEGVPDTTTRRWVSEFPEFAAQVTRARANAMKNFVVRSLKGEKGSSNAEFHLERRFREDYGPVQKIVLDTEDDLTDDERRAQVSAYREAVVGRLMPAGSDGVHDPGAGAAEADAGGAPPGTPPAS